MTQLSTKPYLIRAIYEWCVDSGNTPYLAVAVDANTRVPQEYVKDGEIVLSIGPNATRNLSMGNELIQFSARFGGTARELSVPVEAVIGIFARENSQGMFFPGDEHHAGAETATDDGSPEDPPEGGEPAPPGGRPRLRVVK